VKLSDPKYYERLAFDNETKLRQLMSLEEMRGPLRTPSPPPSLTPEEFIEEEKKEESSQPFAIAAPISQEFGATRTRAGRVSRPVFRYGMTSPGDIGQALSCTATHQEIQQQLAALDTSEYLRFLEAHLGALMFCDSPPSDIEEEAVSTSSDDNESGESSAAALAARWKNRWARKQGERVEPFDIAAPAAAALPRAPPRLIAAPFVRPIAAPAAPAAPLPPALPRRPVSPAARKAGIRKAAAAAPRKKRAPLSAEEREAELEDAKQLVDWTFENVPFPDDRVV